MKHTCEGRKLNPCYPTLAYDPTVSLCSCDPYDNIANMKTLLSENKKKLAYVHRLLTGVIAAIWFNTSHHEKFTGHIPMDRLLDISSTGWVWVVHFSREITKIIANCD